MAETRRVAAAYYKATKATLPLSNEIAKYDACRLLQLSPSSKSVLGVDAYDMAGIPVQIKSRVIFNTKKNSYRIGQLSPEGQWQKILLVLLDPDYEPFEIYALSREILEENLSAVTENSVRRGPLSVGRFRMLAELVWERTT